MLNVNSEDECVFKLCSASVPNDGDLFASLITCEYTNLKNFKYLYYRIQYFFCI